ncbi:MAG TPA: hypothetical protein VGV91_11495 [Rubrobacter sp.]|nr:hypothetical protein [Rubrobacter sp.]
MLWGCAALVAVLVVLAWAAPELQEEPAMLLAGCAAAVPGTVGSAFLFWHEIRANRRELREARRESRDVPFEEGAEWTSKAIYYGVACFLFFSISWYVVPGLLFS